LKHGDVDSLLTVVKTIEVHTTALHRLQPPIEASLQRVFEVLGKDGEKRTLSRLVDHLPSEHRARMRSFQHTLAGLQERVRQVNERNKTYIREHVTFLSNLTSLMIRPVVENPCYPKTGQSGPAVSLPYTLSREV
jgi:iron-sulfur cluster repair protein YtfE (RIC family)